MKLYHVPGARSARVLWLLLELEVPHEVVPHSITDGSLRTPSYRAIHPLGRVPALTDGDQTFYESGAIVQYVLERYGEGRLEPAVWSPERPRYLQWFHWGEASLLPPIVTMNSHRFVLKEADRSAKAVDVAERQLAQQLGVLEAAIDGRHFLVGDTFSAADIMVGYGVTLARRVGALPDTFPAIETWLDGLASRPAYARTFREGFGA